MSQCNSNPVENIAANLMSLLRHMRIKIGFVNCNKTSLHLEDITLHSSSATTLKS